MANWDHSPPITNSILLVKDSAIGAQEGVFVSVLADVPNLTPGFDIGVDAVIKIFALKVSLRHSAEGRVVFAGQSLSLVFRQLINGWLLNRIRCLKRLCGLSFCDYRSTSAITDIDVIFFAISSLFNRITISTKLSKIKQDFKHSEHNVIDSILVCFSVHFC